MLSPIVSKYLRLHDSDRLLGLVTETATTAFKRPETDETVEAAFELFRIVGDDQGHRARLLWFLSLHDREFPRAFSRVLGKAWSRGNISRRFTSYREMAHLFQDALKADLMSATELARFDSLAEKLTIFRGGSTSPIGKPLTAGKLRYGMSWTTSQDRAEWFARRWGSEPILLRATVDRANVLAVFDYENEVVVRSGRVRNVEMLDVTAQRGESLLSHHAN